MSSRSAALQEFHRHSMFEVQRFLTAVLLLVSCGMMLADNPYGSLVGILTLTYYAFIHINPFVKDDQSSQQQSWVQLMKHLAVIGGLMLVMARGKIQREEEQVGFHAPRFIGAHRAR